ncbi:rhodanese-like domain-containing protein [Thiohalomonas denitrificans]|uniref:rhodanese-like domain-containing protein n=1 Tax=Thiohalomonas denitrificans TaxID=415747 RepID=UPI0026EEE7AB|nr:rhodanese-like domain-containing protein [Thiohalomonas denitrificans]
MHQPFTSRLIGIFVLFGSLVIAMPANALDVNLTEDKASFRVNHHNKMIDVRRDQDGDNLVDAMWAKTSRNCPPFCIQPSTPVAGVELFTETDLFDFMEQKVNPGDGFLIDARLPDWYLRGTIPGSINIPFTVFQRETDHPNLIEALNLLGVGAKREDGTITRLIDSVFGDSKKSGHWDFSKAKEVVLWCNGPWCGQSPHAIRALAKLGYPIDKIKYYRGGMQMWQLLGLNTIVPEMEEVLFFNEQDGE